jgi:hypothetical protein
MMIKLLILVSLFLILSGKNLLIKQQKRLLFGERFENYRPLFKRDNLEYVAFHCDRNIYKLCQKSKKIEKLKDSLHVNKYYAVIITNKNKRFIIR